MSDLDDFLSANLDQAFGQIGGKSITCGAVTRQCILSPFTITTSMRAAGYWTDATDIAELTRADYTALGLSDRVQVSVSGRTMKVMQIEDDPHDPMVRVHLKLDED